jgi:uncharacterized protein (TIGR03382 family)
MQGYLRAALTAALLTAGAVPAAWAQQMCGQFVDVITAPSGKVGNHACDSDHDGAVKDSNYCYCDDCSIQPERCHRRGDVAFCGCDPARQHCRPRPCIAQGSCSASDPHSYYWALDCNDYNRDRFPENCEVCGDAVDDDCDGRTDDCSGADLDGDGFSSPQDCNDNNPQAYPGATELPCNSVDEDCSGADDCGGDPTDPDHDGYSAPADCDEGDASVYPGAPDVCGDGENSDCDPLGLDCPDDADGDGVPAGPDCDDHDPAVYPGATERCGDGVDQDCSGQDRACVRDQDRDGFDAASAGGADCDDLDSRVYPGALEACGDGVDQDCQGGDVSCERFDRDADGFAGVEVGGADCDDDDDSVYPGAPEVCGDGVDSNCDRQPDRACPTDVDQDGDGFESAAYGGADCNDRDSRVSPIGLEVCGDRVDNDCNGVADDHCGQPVAPEDARRFVNAGPTSCGGCATGDGAASSALLFLLGLGLLRRRR